MPDTFITNHDVLIPAPVEGANLVNNDPLTDEDVLPDIKAPSEAELEEELEELVIEDFTIDGICGVY